MRSLGAQLRTVVAFMGVAILTPTAARAQQSLQNQLALPSAANPHGAVTESCSLCHKADGWKPAVVSPNFKHAERSFPLDGAHLRTTCTSCHRDLTFAKTPTGCASCHKDVHTGEVGTQCGRCHTTRSFLDLAAMRRSHETSRFPLRGAHNNLECESCHMTAQAGKLQFTGRPVTCIGCHAASFRQAKAPDHQSAKFSQDCTSCHTENSWASTKFDHATTRFALVGAHRSVSCNSCHADKVYTGKSMECAGCHQAAFAASKSPPHVAAGFSTSCANCHNAVQWKGATFNHANTQFPLTGAHLASTCSSCHADGVYRGKPSTCISCHQQNFAASVRPPHQSLAFSTTCTTCHTTQQWLGASYDHSVTNFQLTGAHRAVACASCHANGVYRGTASSCASCHQAKYTATTNPPHAAAGFPTSCEACHATANWTSATFNHSATRFALTGAHLAASCASCHSDGVYRGKTMLCSGCHQAKYAATTNPPHAAAGFGATCESCHTTLNWTSATFNHSATRFALTGAHLAASCASCHSDGVYHGKTIVCSGCHQAKYAATTNPPHAAAGFPTTCETCHTTTRWPGAVFNHANTQFPLTGAHVAALCSACHSDGVYHGKPTACVSCHQQKYNASTMPPHQSLAFSTVCTTCHTTAAWAGGTYNHSTTTFPLTGAHLAVSCNGCHADKVYRGKPKLCASCHQAKYNATTNPPHLASGFPTTCETCHTTTQWPGAVFNHSSSRFPLTGLHATTPCASCHSDGVYHGKTLVCSGCHLPKYNATTSPAHSAAGFPTTCETCHTPNGWTPSSWSHESRFPIATGNHKRSCVTCHTAPSDYHQFSCFNGCHAKATTDSHHQGRAGYVYNSPNCYACHPQGRAG